MFMMAPSNDPVSNLYSVPRLLDKFYLVTNLTYSSGSLLSES